MSPGSISCIRKIATSILLKLSINSNEIYHTNDTPLAHERNSIFKYKQHTIHHHRRPEQLLLHNGEVRGDTIEGDIRV